jgi:hypothetical protein
MHNRASVGFQKTLSKIKLMEKGCRNSLIVCTPSTHGDTNTLSISTRDQKYGSDYLSKTLTKRLVLA